MFDWNDLRYLLAVADEGTLVGAARVLGVKHTTVARRIAALEDALGSRVVRKGAERYSLTPAGEEVLALATELRAKADAIERRVAGLDARVAGVVRVTMPDNVAGWFVRELPALRERYPDLVVDVLADLRVYDLLAGEADIALRVAPAAAGDLVERKLCHPSWSVYASRAYVARRGRTIPLNEHDLIGLEGPLLSKSPGAEWYREHAPQATFVMRCNSALQVFNAVLMGAGVAPLPCFMGDSEPLMVRLVPDAFHNRRMRLLVPAELARLARVRAVMDFCVELFARDSDLFEGRRPQPEA